MENKKDYNGPVDSWSSWKVYVIKTLEKLESKQNNLEKDFHSHTEKAITTLTELKTKINFSSGIISFTIGAIISLIVTVCGGMVVYNMTKNNIHDQIDRSNKIEYHIDKEDR